MITIEDLFFQYDEQLAPLFSNLNLKIEEGESVAIMGANGCGKSTLAYIVSGIIPHLMKGQLKGNVCVLGKNLQRCKSLGDFSKDVAFLFQNPEDQFISFTVKDELDLAAPETTALGPDGLNSIREYLSQYNAVNLLDKSPKEMSMGEVQRVSIIAAAYQKPKLIILDEPTTALDFEGLSLVTTILQSLQKTTKIVNTHDLFWAKRSCERIIGIKNGKVAFNLPSFKVDEEDFLSLFDERFSNEQLKMLTRLIDFLEEQNKTGKKEVRVQAASVSHAYFQSQKTLINDVSIEVSPGEIFCIMGPNGSGKTTMLLILSELLKPKKGRVYFNGLPIEEVRSKNGIRIAVMLQNPSYQIISDSIREELCLSLYQVSKSPSFIKQSLEFIQNALGLSNIESNPRLLSFGWQKMLSFVCCLCLNPDIFILDEPELGLDPTHRNVIVEMIRYVASRSKTVIMSCHDPKFMQKLAGTGLFICDGQAEFYDTNKDLLEKHYSHANSR